MAQITLLNHETIDKIAAGEVVEAPFSIVKELVENSIDANASLVTVEIVDGGVSMIRVTDNGSGIEESQVEKAFLRHATSKLKSINDLESLNTLGFRGEALSSIAAVSQVELVTCSLDSDLGYRYCINGGVFKNDAHTGAPKGTSITVRNLFYNVPARKKFLKSYMTEASHVQDVVTRLASAHPDIGFVLKINGQTKLQTNGDGNLKNTIYSVFGREISNRLIPVDFNGKRIAIKGFAGSPEIIRGNRGYEYFDLNGRYFNDKVISKAIEDAYHPYLMLHKYPFVLLHISIDPSEADVNVHPGKMEVKFKYQREIYDDVFNALSDALRHYENIPEVVIETKNAPVFSSGGKTYSDVNISSSYKRDFVNKKADDSNVKEESKVEFFDTGYDKNKKYINDDQENREEFFLEKMRERVAAFHKKKDETITQNKDEIVNQNSEEQTLFDFLKEKKIIDQSNKNKFHVIGQVFDTYWMIEMEDKLLIVDQHAAHEKVLFEEFCKKFENENILSQMISPPIMLALNMKQQEILKEHISDFKHLGFEIEPFGGDDYIITGVPSDFSDVVNEGFFLQILDEYEEELNHKKITSDIEHRLATMACKAAVKGNRSISKTEMEVLLSKMLEADNPYNCPHGRPTMISITSKELEKKFKRII